MLASLVCTATCSNLGFESFELKLAQNFKNKNIKEVEVPNLNEIFKEASNTERVSTLKSKANFAPGMII